CAAADAVGWRLEKPYNPLRSGGQTMNWKLSNPWRWTGTVDRGEYFFWAVVLFAAKFNLDRFLSSVWFDLNWSIFDWRQTRLYLWQIVPAGTKDPRFLVFVVAALPFLWAGVALTLRRLRSAECHLLWVVLFFVPLLKLVLFAFLCLQPAGRRVKGV